LSVMYHDPWYFLPDSSDVGPINRKYNYIYRSAKGSMCDTISLTAAVY